MSEFGEQLIFAKAIDGSEVSCCKHTGKYYQLMNNRVTLLDSKNQI